MYIYIYIHIYDYTCILFTYKLSIQLQVPRLIPDTLRLAFCLLIYVEMNWVRYYFYELGKNKLSFCSLVINGRTCRFLCRICNFLRWGRGLDRRDLWTSLQVISQLFLFGNLIENIFNATHPKPSKQ